MCVCVPALSAEQYGQLDCELAEPYYLYGRSLLEVARIQNTVLGSGIPGEDGVLWVWSCDSALLSAQ